MSDDGHMLESVKSSSQIIATVVATFMCKFSRSRPARFFTVVIHRLREMMGWQQV
jgi:hypothetical protein